ncbi:carboxypeptidase regulatory-like domain-containing protein [Polaromonas sp. P1-6]|nr:carboxypeptidase regulatory-like domain-containing protein [Polaromonas sp. P1-6]
MRRVNGLALLLLSSSLLIPSIGFSAEAAMGLTPKTEDGITYVSGGIGAGQAQAMKNMRKDYNLQLTFAEKGTGEYLADIKVNLQDAMGKKVLETVSPGPLFTQNYYRENIRSLRNSTENR